MTIKYACFISYAHGQGNLLELFMNQLVQALKDYLSIFLREGIYIDTERLKPGYKYEESSARVICESACMVVVYSPLYEKSPYCLREFLTMEQIEKERMPMLGEKYDRNRRMIIPIIVRGGPQDLPPKIKEIAHADLSKLLLAGQTDLNRRPEFSNVIRAICEAILEQNRIVRNLVYDCDSFVLPTPQEAMRSWNKSTKPTTFLPFPGRDI